ncbi:MAG TPA: antibiotic biosynthesis monooxygenase [Oceanospirillales bacterium]|mgnify:CR=1 FL=1|nr:antibiotic biosynthesis monooxygenase [Oceanospirillaceae bacterium]HBS41690.1 antibiotic biosynthesis monooxygenase [Oceanospirillales bacterium]|tara:strand:+ start:1226 stop:1507 length:282 start_codon:yes stop_codon:yes gene_type:complete
MIKVIIEREIDSGMETTYEDAIKNTLRAILEAPGYTSGATYKDAENPNRRFIITNWQSLEDWQIWARSQQRSDVVAAVRATLRQPEKVTILTA